MVPLKQLVFMEFWSFVKSKFEILLLTGFVLFFSSYVLHAAHNHMPDLIAYGIDNNKLFVGALLGLLTGRAMALTRKADNGNGNGASDGNGTAGH